MLRTDFTEIWLIIKVCKSALISAIKISFFKEFHSIWFQKGFFLNCSPTSNSVIKCFPRNPFILLISVSKLNYTLSQMIHFGSKIPFIHIDRLLMPSTQSLVNRAIYIPFSPATSFVFWNNSKIIGSHWMTLPHGVVIQHFAQ